VQQEGIADRVSFLGTVDEDRLLELYAGARAVVYPPFDEDFGYVTLEAFLASKPVITCTDSGGPLELVEDGVNGLVCDPTPVSVGTAIARLACRTDLAERLGKAGRERAQGITWDGVVERLIGDTLA
jgi:glycosyltransferase involved in cell wall biosynthesis